MKFAVILGDGMADLPVEALGGKTPLMCADKPTIDFFAKNGEVGLVKTVADELYPGSDTANLSVMGYDPKLSYTGRSPLEAVSMGINLSDTDTTFRCNLVSLSDESDYSQKKMIDYSSDEISTEEARELINAAAKVFDAEGIKLYPGISYRHCLVYNNFKGKPSVTAPHDITGKKITEYLPKGESSEKLAEIMKKSYAVLNDHPINVERRAKGLLAGNSLWFWGQGTKPQLPKFQDKFGLKGAVISAVDLIKGIAIVADMKSIEVEGATGNIHTNFKGKGEAALSALTKDGYDFVYVHIEAPDECGHRQEIQNKVKSIELIDKYIVKPIFDGLKASGEDFAFLVVPDHPTPVMLRTHTRAPVPYVIYRSNAEKDSTVVGYDEQSAASTGIFIEHGPSLMPRFLQK